jgi:hypothetical protein
MSNSMEYTDKKYLSCENWGTAITNLTDANQKFSVQDNNYSSLEWDETNNLNKPTEAEIEAEITRLVEIWDSTEDPKQKRKEEYPAIEEQLDNIFHNGVDAWKADIQAIKDKYPKS